MLTLPNCFSKSASTGASAFTKAANAARMLGAGQQNTQEARA